MDTWDFHYTIFATRVQCGSIFLRPVRPAAQSEGIVFALCWNVA